MEVKLINIGTPERPVMIPEEAIKLSTKEGEEWWNMLASGSAILELEDLDKLLELSKGDEV